MSTSVDCISVIVPNLHSPIVGRTLESLERQDYPGDYEIIVVGQDKYGQVVEGERVRSIVTPQPVIQSIARNRGIEAACGSLLAFIDSDCVADPSWLSRLARHYADPNVGVVGGGVSFPADNFWTYCDNLGTFHEYLDRSRPGTRDQLPSLNLSVRHSALDAVGLFDETLPIGEDVDLTTRLREKGYRLYFDPQARVTHLPPRRSALSILQHAYRFGRYSRKLDPRYHSLLETAWPLRRWWTALLFAPALAGGVAARMLLREGLPARDLPALPVIFLIKLVWCLGAARTLWANRKSGRQKIEAQ